jgi:hypothetical protein
LLPSSALERTAQSVKLHCAASVTGVREGDAEDETVLDAEAVDEAVLEAERVGLCVPLGVRLLDDVALPVELCGGQGASEEGTAR